MTPSVFQYSGRVRTVAKKITSTTATAVYAADPETEPLVVAINIANTSASAVTVTLAKYEAATATTFAILSGGSVPANGRLEFSSVPIQMTVNDAIQVTAGTANTLEALVTAIEQTGRLMV